MGNITGPAGFTLGHRPGLDVVRGVAIALVVAAHMHVPGFSGGGQAGVVLFFVLSGFLITRLLVEERRSSGRVDLRRFYRRRFFRLAPALVAIVAVLLLTGKQTVGDTVPVLAYVGNLTRAWAGDSLGWLNHSWSLAIEEQFYLVWPLALLRLRNPTRALVAVVIASLTLRAVAPFDVMHFDTLARADAISLGCLMGLHADQWTARPPRWAGPVGAALVAASTVGVLDMRVALTVASVGSVGLVAAGLSGRHVPGLTWLGKRSYGLYLWHVPIVAVLPAVPALVMSLVVTELSWRLVERPALRLRSRRSQTTPVNQTGGRRPEAATIDTVRTSVPDAVQPSL